ncbi:GTPase ERA-like, chloroplastic isoform X2 [Salvia miltiorrhiza]|uniref:GTPase ERA-like, chloroplastic isoform X2 n=1 Tax=Salvia miltiorrhiza TaxID=226208 RepID=UPI0025AB77B5|nr:GTPase ERA-like, chloroplastic isoform X2 [Salvia miltiorrhiza]
MKEFALQYNIPLPPTTKIGIFHRRTFPLFQSTRNRGVNYSSAAAGSRIKSNKPPQVEEFEDGLCNSRYYVRSKDEEDEVEEDEETSSSMLLSLSMKPDRNMSLLDDYEMEEMDYVSDDPNHRSGYVAVVGKPNVGKSTLSNQMIGQKLSIVTDKPQTTRHRILGICSGSDYQMILYDTPGVIEKRMHKLDSMMMKNVRSAAINADCVVIVVDACRAPEKIDEVLEQGVGDHTNKLPTLLVLNKKDLIKPGEIAKKIEWYEKFTDVDEVIPVSAKFGHGVDDVKEWILSKLPRGPAYYPKDISSEHPERFFVGEIVREKIFMQYRNEVPYACQIDEVLEQGVGDRTNKLPTLLVLNKKDLIKPGEIAKKIKWYEKFTDVDEVIPVSAKFGHGVDDVKEWILSKLPRGPAYYPKDISSEHPERFFVGEIVREKIFMQYRNEVPYACQVNVISYKSRPNAKDFIQVEIVVEKNSQKIILIGKEGKALKVLATAARLDIEDFLQKNVFLEIEVKVKENWRQNEGLLKYYGYGGQIQAL